MPIAINGSGTVTGVSVGGLPDGIVDNDTIANSTIAEGKLAANVNTITMADQWRVTSNFTPSQAATVSSNWERNDQFFGYIGSGMSQSSGEFTFPETGIYKVTCFYGGFLSSGNAGYMGIQMRVSSDSGTGYSNIASSYQHVTSGPSNPHFSGTTEAFIDVTDASTFRVKLLVDRNASTTFFGHTDRNMTGLTFIRLGDT